MEKLDNKSLVDNLLFKDSKGTDNTNNTKPKAYPTTTPMSKLA